MTTARQLLTQLREHSGAVSGEDGETQLRRMLRKQPPNVVMAMFFAKFIADEERPLIVQTLKNRFQSEHDPGRAMLRWVYGESPLDRLATYYKPPSRSKQTLVWEILHRTRRSLPWLTSRTLHAMAFRPEYFASRRFEATDERVTSWGPLYRRVPIDRSPGRPRILEIPNRPLRIVQRALLELLSPALVKQLDPGVHGIRASGTIFDHASAHLGQRFIVSFDLTNFFPSVKLAYVIGSLKKLPDPMFVRKHRQEIPPDPNLPRIGSPPPPIRLEEPIPWENDAIILISRLCTCRGHLPQGAPTSPLLANIAFTDLDRRIRKALGRNFVYTRYFDDLTVSVSRRVAIDRKINSPQDLEHFVRERLNSVLAPSGFVLNPRKTRSSALSEGHLITGLRVSDSGIDFPRKSKRYIRSLTHAIETYGLIRTSDTWIGNETIAHTSLKQPVSYKPPQHFLESRRTSTERLAILMLRRVAPELVISRNLDEVTARRHKTSSVRLEHEQYKWDAIQYLLGYSWQGSVTPAKSGDNMVEFHTDDNRPPVIEGGSWIEFFLLGKQQAIKVTELWHQANGLAAFLRSAPTKMITVRNLADRLTQTLEKATLGAAFPIHPDSQAELHPLVASSDLMLSAKDELWKLTKRLADDLEEYAKKLDKKISITQNQFIKIAKPVNCDQGFYDFLKTIDQIILKKISHLPIQSKHDILCIVREGSGLSQGTRLGRYIKIERFKNSLRSQDILHGQEKILRELREYFHLSLNQSTKQDKDAWKSHQSKNPYQDQDKCIIKKKLEKVAEDLMQEHDRLVEAGFLNKSSMSQLREGYKELLLICDSEASSKECWKEIHLAASLLHKTIKEAINHDLFNENIKSLINGDHALYIVKLMRNRDAHLSNDSDNSRIRDWKKIQRYVAKLIGRRWDDKTEDEMRITWLEAAEAKLFFLELITKLLRNLLAQVQQRHP